MSPAGEDDAGECSTAPDGGGQQCEEGQSSEEASTNALFIVVDVENDVESVPEGYRFVRAMMPLQSEPTCDFVPPVGESLSLDFKFPKETDADVTGEYVYCDTESTSAADWIENRCFSASRGVSGIAAPVSFDGDTIQLLSFDGESMVVTTSLTDFPDSELHAEFCDD